MVTPEQTTPPQSTRAAFASVACTPRAARAFARVTLRARGRQALIEQAEAVVSELVTNAVKATLRSSQDTGRLASPTPVSLALLLNEGVLHIAVQDSAAEQPALQVPDEDAEHGRGLLLVAALSLVFNLARHPTC
ncbi:ATP-binding protein [Actinacidiphila sp. ITFR-21]|uniref:ATP-binding protein n=1 Tax=Actinacidiphila sp. ITFR-21 TaxID=3075199 RepID=UPI00288B9725|nr:ATP-binding protein [Streptomyces sp. ITFR-21]WNI18714.1 ATP-binding protein [Streptomyces sp. ITFR-21]